MENKEKVSPAKQNTILAEAYQMHQDLLKTIEVMDEKIDEVIKQHEAEFLLAYRNHIKNMKEELTAMKIKAEEQEKKMLSNDRAVYLQKQLILFREQALKLYDKLEEKTQECEHHKSQAKDFEKLKIIVEKENRELLKENKSLEATISIQQNRMKEQLKEIGLLKNDLESSRAHFKHLSKGNTLTALQFTENVEHPFTPKPKELLNFSVQSKKYSKNSSLRPQQDSAEKRLSMRRSSTKKSQEWMDHELKNWFLECIETIRKEVAQRKVYGYKSQDLNAITNWEEFRMIDKLRLLEMFMQNEKLLVWMYERIFPSRMTEIEEYLSAKPHNVFESREKSKSAYLNVDDMRIELLREERDPAHSLLDDLSNDHILPKVLPFAHKKATKKLYDVRQRIDIRNGKLNLSSINNDI